MTYWVICERYVDEPEELSIVDVYQNRGQARRKMQSLKLSFYGASDFVFEMFRLVKVR